MSDYCVICFNTTDVEWEKRLVPDILKALVHKGMNSCLCSDSTPSLFEASWHSHLDNEESWSQLKHTYPPLLSLHMSSGATITARERSKQDLPLLFSTLQEQLDFRSWWASTCSPRPGEVIAVCNKEKKTHQCQVQIAQYRPAVVSLTPAVFNPLSYFFPPHNQQLPLDNFHRNDNSLDFIIWHNQTSR